MLNQDPRAFGRKGIAILLAAWTKRFDRATGHGPAAGEQRHVNVFDVSDYIIGKIGAVTTMKLQKLVYYCQAWSLVWDERPLFPSRIEAWAGGPVVPDLFQAHRGEFLITNEPNGDRGRLDKDARETIDAVLETYGDKAATWLSALSHSEDPWIDARKGLAEGERGNRPIGHAQMAEFYGNL